MEKRENKKSAVYWAMFGAMVVIDWLVLIACKAVGAVVWSWPVVLLGIVWIPVFMLVASTVIAYAVIYGAVAIKYRRRKKAIEARVRAQARAAGVWHSPEVLGGRALELSARENFGIKKKAGETDAQLRERCKEVRQKWHVPTPPVKPPRTEETEGSAE